MSDLTTSNPPIDALERLLRPKSIAIAGVSTNPGALGSQVLANLRLAGFAGELHLINPKRPLIDGQQSVASIDELPAGIDCAVLAIPRAGVLPTVEACARRGIGGVVVFAAGFAEAGPEGLAEQQELARLARQSGMAVEGPNCLGAVNFIDGTPLTFVKTPCIRLGDRPGIAIVSQSGAMSAVVSVALRSRDLGISFSVSTGNEAASGVEDYIDYLLGNAETRVISLVVEQFRQPKRFLALARRARQLGKLIVLVHPGRSSAARASAATHTGAMAGNYQVMLAMLHHAGIIIVDSLEELLDVSEVAIRSASLPNGGAAVLAESGWFKALTLDLCEQIGLDLPALSPAGEAALRATLPDFIPPSNPLDLTAQALVDPDLYRRTLEVMLSEERYGSIVIPIILTDAATCRLKLPPILEAIRTLKPTKPVVFARMDEGAEFPQEFIDQLRQLGITVFPSPERAFRALAKLTEFAARKLRDTPPPATKMPAVLDAAGVIPEYRSKAILAAAGIGIPAGGFATSIDEAKAVAERIGYPVALKAQSADLSHKTDAGGVILALSDAAALEAGWHRLYANIARAAPGLTLDGALVEGMAKRGVELIVGARNDPDWGAVVLVGLGGVLAELLQDSRLLPADLTIEAIRAELDLLKSSALFHGYRGSPALDIDAATEIVWRVGQLVGSNDRIKEVDVNPIVVYPQGEGAVALDALIVVA